MIPPVIFFVHNVLLRTKMIASTSVGKEMQFGPAAISVQESVTIRKNP